MAKVEILLPAMGKGIIEATITKWMVNVGDKIEEDQSLVEVATDKVDSEIPAPQDGIIEKILFNENDVPKVGDIIAVLSTNGSETDQPEDVGTEIKSDNNTITKNIPNQELVSAEKPEIQQSIQIVSKTNNGKFLSPLVRSIAEKEHISVSELDKINGSGNTGRITKTDILYYLNTRNNTGIDLTQNHRYRKKPLFNKFLNHK
ncbi:MAG: E3 binding domain-containing protein [Bacteroidales bacterium]|nr:E3 binding domain-containing protein [Bacteroidales bacterium]